MNRLLITICGRAGSKGFKNKNLKTFCGHPLVYYSLSAAELFIKKHPELHIDIALNTDSPELAELVTAKYPEVIFLPRGEELGGGRCRPSVVSDAFEATIAALFLDGGIETARNFILPFITEGKTAEDDHKTALQEVVQKHPDDRLTYTVTGESGPAHDKRFQVTVALNGKALAVGEGRSKKAAEQQAAKAALTKLEQQA